MKDIPETPGERAMRPGAGFALFLFDYGAGGGLAYVATGKRPQVRALLLEWPARTEPDPDTRGVFEALYAAAEEDLRRG